MARPIPLGEPARRARGYTYLGLLFFIFLAGLGMAVAGHWWQIEIKREREAELLFVGDQFRRAIASYHGSASGAAQYPKNLDDLVEDRRHPAPLRHLRRIYRDPITGEAQWDLVKEGEFIVGVRSKSKDKPIKSAGFPERYKEFANAASYEQWRFVHRLDNDQQGAEPVAKPPPGTPVAPPSGEGVGKPLPES